MVLLVLNIAPNFFCTISSQVLVRQTGRPVRVRPNWGWDGIGWDWLEIWGQCLDHETVHETVHETDHGKGQRSGTVENARPGPYGRTKV